MWRLFLNKTSLDPTFLIRYFSSSNEVFKLIPNLVEFKFVRSSGPGGQNVNKVSSACEARVNVLKLALPQEVLNRLLEQQRNKINAKQELVVYSQEDRSQHRNREICLDKINKIVEQAFIEPKQRIVQRTPPEKTKEKWREEKMHRKSIKEYRRSKDDF